MSEVCGVCTLLAEEESISLLKGHAVSVFPKYVSKLKRAKKNLQTEIGQSVDASEGTIG